VVGHRQKTAAKDAEESIEAPIIIPNPRMRRSNTAVKAGRRNYEHD